MKKLTFVLITMLFAAVSVLSAASYASPSEVSTVDAVRFNKKGNLWYAVIDKDKAKHIRNSYVSAIVFRDCRWNQPQKRQCYDSYVYNISKCGVKQTNRTRFVNSVINKVN